MSYPLYCPDCEGDEIQALMDGVYECQSCGRRFTNNATHPSITTELKRQTAMLRKLTTLLERHLRRGFTEDDKAAIRQTLATKRGLTTDDVAALVHCSKNAALALMKEIGAEGTYRYIQGSGNRPSRLVRVRASPNTPTG